jgi:hypothetical protein
MLNKLYKKICAGIIVSAMVFSMIPAGAIEASSSNQTQSITENKQHNATNISITATKQPYYRR